jgi:hypothetical protein
MFGKPREPSTRKTAKDGVTQSRQPQRLKFLGYALPRGERDNESRIISHDGFEIHDEPLMSSVSFLDFDGVVLFAGSFERAQNDQGMGFLRYSCLAPADLDLREREFHTLLSKDGTIIFLVPKILQAVGYARIDSHIDLYSDGFLTNLILAG